MVPCPVLAAVEDKEKSEGSKFSCTVSVLGREEGYSVKYTPSPEGVPEGTPEGEGVYLTVYPELSPNTDSI